MYVIAFLIGFFSMNFKAQAQWAGSSNIVLAAPVGDLSNVVGVGFGLNVNGHYFVNDNFAVGGGLQYLSFSGKSIGFGITIPCINYTSFYGNAMYFFNTNDLQPYIGGDLGLYTTTGGSNLGIAPAFGINYKINDNLKLNFAGKYNIIFASGGSASFIPINAGVLYKF